MPKTVAELTPQDITADTDLPPIGDPPAPPTPPAEADAPPSLSAGQRAFLDGLVGRSWTQAVEAKVASWAETTDNNGAPVAVLQLTEYAFDGTVEVRPPLAAEEVAELDARRSATNAEHAEEVAAWEAERAAWDHLAALHRSREAARQAQAEAIASAKRAEEEAARFNAAVDERVDTILRQRGITPTK